MPRATLPPPRLSLNAALPSLGIGRTSFYRQGWDDVFSDYRAGRDRRISQDELTEALVHPDPAKAKEAVLRLRKVLGRIGNG